MLANLPEGQEAGDIITYEDFLNQIYPRDEQGTWSEEVKETRAKLHAAFARPGGPGAKFKNQQEKILKTLTLPKGAKEELGITDEGGLTIEESENEQKKEKDE